jgi:hypothetical protein
VIWRNAHVAGSQWAGLMITARLRKIDGRREESQTKEGGKERIQEAKQERLLREKAKQDYDQCRNEIVSRKVLAIKQKLGQGEKVLFYNKVYLPVDSKVVDEIVAKDFDIGILRRLGLSGWDVVAVVPGTLGIALTNVSFGSSSGQTWGAGVGGNVVGVHIVLRKEISTETTPKSDETLTKYINTDLFNFLSEEEAETLKDLWDKSQI